MYALIYEKYDYDSSEYKLLYVSDSYEKLDEKIQEYAAQMELCEFELKTYKEALNLWEKECKEAVKTFYDKNRHLLKEPGNPEGNWEQNGKPYTTFVKKTKQDIQIRNLVDNFRYMTDELSSRDLDHISKFARDFPSLPKFERDYPTEIQYNPHYLKIDEVEVI